MVGFINHTDGFKEFRQNIITSPDFYHMKGNNFRNDVIDNI